jgi:hypothetical protein
MTEQEELARAFEAAMQDTLAQHTELMKACLTSALRWQIDNRQMPEEQAEQIIMNTGAALVAALKGIAQFHEQQKAQKPAIILPEEQKEPNFGPKHHTMHADTGLLFSKGQ